MCRLFKSLAISVCLVVSFVCANPIGIKAADESVVRPDGWTEETHGKKADPNYSLVFPDDKVNRIDINISSTNYSKMENNLKSLNFFSSDNPIYVPATVKFNDVTWTNVGVRYKGNSSLNYSKQAGNHKFPLHLKFDEYEDQIPEIKNQRFYGFKDLILGNNWFDSSYIRDKVTSDIFRSAGVPAANCSFYRVYVDTGSGPLYWGLYTGFESPDDEMLNTQFANGDGNMYKGQKGTGGNLATFNKQGYEKKTNVAADDWSDLQALVTALNAPKTDAAKWRANLEAVFDVNLFLKWLAVNTSITNFDTYGWVTKNHYLYQDLANNGRLVYIPWDFNLSLTTDPLGIMGNPDTNFGGFGGGAGGDWGAFGGFAGGAGAGANADAGAGGGFGGGAGFGGFDFANGWCKEVASLSMDEITNSWPLIRYLLDEPVYKNIYHNEMKSAMSGCFDEAAITTRMTQLHELIRPYVVGAEGETSKYGFLKNGTTQFDQGLTELTNLVTERHIAVNDYLATVTMTPITTSIPTLKPTSTLKPTPTPTLTTSEVLEGDVNGDGMFNAIDFATFRMILLGMSVNKYEFWEKAADLNGDEAQNAIDFAIMRMKLLGQK